MPLLQRVAVSFGNKISFKPTLDEALNDVFDGSSGAPTETAGAAGRR